MHEFFKVTSFNNNYGIFEKIFVKKKLIILHTSRLLHNIHLYRNINNCGFEDACGLKTMTWDKEGTWIDKYQVNVRFRLFFSAGISVTYLTLRSSI